MVLSLDEAILKISHIKHKEKNQTLNLGNKFKYLFMQMVLSLDEAILKICHIKHKENNQNLNFKRQRIFWHSKANYLK